MIGAHALDAWTRPSDRTSTVYGYLLILGGMAAPLFLWLAGLGVGMAAGRAGGNGRKRSEGVEAAMPPCLRIFLPPVPVQNPAFVVSPGGSPLTLFRVDILNIMGPAIAA